MEGDSYSAGEVARHGGDDGAQATPHLAAALHCKAWDSYTRQSVDQKVPDFKAWATLVSDFEV